MQRFEMIGRLGKEIELRKTQSNKSVIEFSLADSEKRNSDDAITTWVKFIAWEKRAENIAKFVRKGDIVYVYGRMRNEEYTTQDGQKRYKTYCLVDGFELLPNKRELPQESTKEDYNTNWSKEPNVDGVDIDMRKLEFY